MPRVPCLPSQECLSHIHTAPPLLPSPHDAFFSRATRSIWEFPINERRRALRKTPVGQAHFLENLNEEYPQILCEQFQSLPLEQYGSGRGPTLLRAPSRMLSADDGRLALMPY
jgi:hypothetical protein